MGSLDDLVHVIRPSALPDPAGALVLLHGRGADEHDLRAVLGVLDPHDRLVGVTPRGPLALPPGGAHWYRVARIGYPDPETFLATYELAGGWLEALAEATGVPPERTVLGGFSQGAVMSYALGLGRGRPRPAAIVALSGFLPTVPGFDLELSGLDGFPVAIGHGSLDPVIDVEWGRKARDAFEAAGAALTYRETHMPHTVDPDFVYGLAPWIEAVTS